MQPPTERPPTPTEHPAASPAAVAAAHAKVERPTPELAEAVRRGYEPKDISLTGLFVFLATLVVTLCLVLVMIYGIMMALVEHDRSNDQLGSPVAIAKAEQYAPLQPSVGHNTEDWEDMDIMRQRTQAVLSSSGTTFTGRHFIDIEQAMDVALPHLRDELASAHPVAPSPSAEGVPDAHEGQRVNVVGGVAVPVVDEDTTK